MKVALARVKGSVGFLLNDATQSVDSRSDQDTAVKGLLDQSIEPSEIDNGSQRVDCRRVWLAEFSSTQFLTEIRASSAPALN